ncbi:FAD-binding oxidoreductase [Paenibacillus sp. UNC499MF]|uniref:NAD(P)/FAD-dependent oxidoreductase n=1 Tax=Paenibacillus sp. UNC499MF TaxID=1502751 RepID=UPI0008A0628D|nr:FAD-dependent oxidoreductase [Paenibacillus sp. UNC499MF]SEG16759.1 Glycine/D-amino acid oxidase [Paenibacillus sp. UNC499MF]
MNLITGEPYWPHVQPETARYPKLERDTECEILIIGGGMSGALAAYRLIQEGFTPVLVDSRDIAGGSTAVNTGIVHVFNDKPLTSCIHTFGEENGVAFYNLCVEAVRILGEICRAEKLDTHFMQRDSLYLASDEKDVPMLLEEYRTLVKYGIQAEYLTPGRIANKFSFTKPGAILTPEGSAINPYAFVHGLIAASAAKGMKVYTGTEIVSRVDTKDGIVFTTRNRCRIRTRRAVYSTGHEAQEIRRNPNAKLLTTYALVTKPLQEITGWHKECMIWETARPYLYMRTTGDGRVIIGGEDERLMSEEERAKRLRVKKDVLLQKAKELFPHLDLQAEYAWAGIFGATHDGYPMIGTQPGFPNSQFSLGYGGNGIVYSVLGAEIIAARATGRPHPGEALFRFDRKRSGIN